MDNRIRDHKRKTIFGYGTGSLKSLKKKIKRYTELTHTAYEVKLICIIKTKKLKIKSKLFRSSHGNVHNDILNIQAENGLMGLIFTILIISTIIYFYIL